MKKKTTNLDEVTAFSKEIFTYQSILNLLHWDQETFMPSGAIVSRCEQISQLSGLIHELKTGQRFRNLLEKHINVDSGVIKSKNLSKIEKANLELWQKEFSRNAKLPVKFIKEFSQVTSEASQIWAIAKKENNFKLFCPFLKKIVLLNREKASILGFSDHPYNALLETYEPSMNVKKLDKLFSHLKTKLKKILNKILKAKKTDTDFLCFQANTESQKALGEQLLKLLPMEAAYSRLDYSCHPFSIAMHPHDSRITTRILSESFISNVFSILHEAGHSMYEMGLPIHLFGTAICQATSLTIHESQSRFWETFIGRSKAFSHTLLSLAKEIFPKKFAKISHIKFYKGINQVQPTFTRVEADEVTYCLHVILRYEIEKRLIEGTLEVEDLPEAWKNLTQDLLGITPPSDTLGCLQDIHWSLGDFGYFPTYALGSLSAAQIFETFTKDHPDWEEKIIQNDLEFIRKWLKNFIHTHGKRYDTETLLKKVTGKHLSEEAFCKYLNKKYQDIY